MKLFLTATAKAKQILWTTLLDQKQFFAFEFTQNERKGDFLWHFMCIELKWIIHLASDTDIRQAVSDLENEGFRVTILYPDEICHEFSNIERLLTEELRDMVGKPCGE
ncbi:MAG: DUF559 domain-containing protein [Saprospiraceae bacterium]|nr:DUF559 domain-containing protein [Saprospiraceae bacterium]